MIKRIQNKWKLFILRRRMIKHEKKLKAINK